MKLGIIRRIPKEDLAKLDKDIPKWVDGLLSPLNDFIEKVGLALQNRLDFENNFLGKALTVTLTHDVETIVNPFPSSGRGNLRVIGVVPVTTGEVFITGFKWTPKDSGNIGITVKLSGATEASIKFHIHLG
jgi:hypothetical protein